MQSRDKKTIDPTSEPDIYKKNTKQRGLCAHPVQFLSFVVSLLSNEAGYTKLCKILLK